MGAQFQPSTALAAADKMRPRVPTYQFGPFKVDTENHQLLRDGQAVAVTPKVFDALLFLVERSGKLVSKDELMAALWPGTFVSDANLTQTIFMLRKALGESASEQRYIVTVPGRGYRFVALDESEETPAVPTSNQMAGGRRSALWVAAISLVTAACALSYFLFAPLSSPRLKSAALLPVTNHANPMQALMTDGTRVYFLEQVGDRFDLADTSVNGGESQRFTAPFSHTRIFDISRDRSDFLIGDFESSLMHMPLWVWRQGGGSPSRVGNVIAEDAAWYFDQQEILYVTGNDIRAVRRDGSADRLFLHTSGYPRSLRWSPDGKRLRFSLYVEDRIAIWEVRADGSDAHPIKLGGAKRECCGTWMPDGRYFIYTAFTNGLENLWAVRDRGAGLHWGAKDPVQLTSGATRTYGALPVQVGNRIFTYVHGTAFESVRLDLRSNEMTSFLPGQQITTMSFAHDGKRVAYEVSLDGSLWDSNVDGSDAREIVPPPRGGSRPQWSPDGKTILFETVTDKGIRAFAIGADGGTPEPVLPDNAEQSLPVWSPDGKNVALALNVDAVTAAERGIFIVEWPSRKRNKIEGSEGLTSPMWSPDKRHLIARTPDHRDILEWDTSAKKWRKIASGRQLAGPFWSGDSQYLYYQDVLEAGQPIYRLRASDATTEKIYSFEKVLAGGVRKALIQAVAPDGSLIISLMRSGVRVHAMDLELP